MAEPTPPVPHDDALAATPSPAASGTTADGLSDAEGAELMRQGAKAAARGEPSGSNPLDAPVNRPGSTGEGEQLWADRHAAWLRGHRTQAPARGVAGASRGPSASEAAPPDGDAAAEPPRASVPPEAT